MARSGNEELNIFASPRTAILLLSLSLSFYSQILEVECREFEWSDIAVPLTGSKGSYNGSPNNLRILISPQRRMNKNLEFDSSNYSQPTAGESQYTSLGGGSSFSSPGQSAAYTALSASLASLKNRLNARGVSLSSRIPADPTAYSTVPSGSYISGESQRPQTQPNYLSVANIQDQPMSYSTSSHENHGNENKTIVLAIPAKINFLTDGSSKRQQQQPQLSNVQSPPNSERSEYIKHYGVINGADGSDQVRENNPEQEHQLVFVNSPTASNANSEQTHLVTTNSFSNGVPPYSAIYYHPTGSMPVKYVQPSSQQAEVYHATSGEEVPEEHYYESCIDTCNSADPRWRKYTVSKYKYCCSHSAQYDPQFETPSVDKVGESVRQAEDVYYNYLHRKARGRRSRKNPRNLRSHNRYHSPRVSEEEQNQEALVTPVKPERHNEYPYMKYYKNRYAHDSHDTQEFSSGRKYVSKDKRVYGRTRDPEVTGGQYEQPSDEEEPARVVSSGYGNSEYSVDNPSYSSDIRSSSAGDEEDTRAGQDEGRGSLKVGQISDGNSDYGVNTEETEEAEPDQSYRSNPKRRKKYNGKGRSRKTSKETQAKRIRKSKTNKEYSMVRPNNVTDYEQAQAEDQYKPDTTTTFDDDSYSKEVDSSGMGGVSGEDSDKDKYKSTLNETAIVHLSKTTMHLKEILSMLEKKTQLKSNETNNPSTTVAPITTTNSYSSLLFNSQLSNPSLSSLDFLSADQGLKNAYKELGLTQGLALPPPYSKLSSTDSFSPLTAYGSSGLSLKNAYKDASFAPSLAALSSYGSKLNPDPFGALSGFSSNQLSLPSTKYLAYAASNPSAIRRRRVPRNPNRYNQMMLSKSQLHGGSTLIRPPSVTRSPYATSASLYHGLQYPSWYTRSSALAATNSYPFRNLYRTTWFQ